MEPELVELIDQIGLSEAYFRFTVEIEHSPLNPRGWIGLALVAEMSGDSNRGRAYRQRADSLRPGYKPRQVSQPVVPPQVQAPKISNSAPASVNEPDPDVQPQSQMLDPSYAPPIYVQPFNFGPWKNFFIFGVFLSCCCCGGILLPSCNKSADQTTAVPPQAPTASVASPAVSDGEGDTPEWKTWELPELGEFSMMVPAEIDSDYTFEHHADHDHLDFKQRAGSSLRLKIDVATPGHGYDLLANAQKLDRSFSTAYGANYHRIRLEDKRSYVIWQFDIVRNGVSLRKSDFFTNPLSGRSSAILVEADPATFAAFEPKLRQLYLTFSESQTPKEPGPGSL